jgi:hypothetical protein
MIRTAILLFCCLLPSLCLADDVIGCSEDRWAGWHEILERDKGTEFGADSVNLYHLNQQMCADISAGRISAEDAAAAYDRAFDNWLDRRQQLWRLRDERKGTVEAG